MQCTWRATLVYLFTFFNLFVGLFGLITFDLFYKTNNTLILHALVAASAPWFRTFTVFCEPNSTAKPSRSVRNIVNVLNAFCTAAKCMCIISIKSLVWAVDTPFWEEWFLPRTCTSTCPWWDSERPINLSSRYGAGVGHHNRRGPSVNGLYYAVAYNTTAPQLLSLYVWVYDLRSVARAK